MRARKSQWQAAARLLLDGARRLSVKGTKKGANEHPKDHKQGCGKAISDPSRHGWVLRHGWMLRHGLAPDEHAGWYLHDGFAPEKQSKVAFVRMVKFCALRVDPIVPPVALLLGFRQIKYRWRRIKDLVRDPPSFSS